MKREDDGLMEWQAANVDEALDVIELRGITAFGYHGVMPEERRNGQTFRADVRLHFDARPAAESDDLSLTVDYSKTAKRVAEILAGPPQNLVETVATMIADAVLENSRVELAEVTVHKPGAALGVAHSGVAVHLRRARRRSGSATFVAPDSALFEAVSAAERRAGLVGPPLEDDDASGNGNQPLAPQFSPAAVNQAGAKPTSEPRPQRRPAVPLRPSGQTRIWPGARAREMAAVSSRGAEPFPAPGPLAASAPSAHGVLGAGSVPDARRPRLSSLNSPVSSVDQAPAEPVDAIIALGANLGEALATLRSALQDLRDEPGVEVVAVSPLARTAPIGHQDQPDFFNAVAHIRTTLSPRALLATLQGIEDKHGRQRLVRWAPRTLDLDLIAYDTLLADEEGLVLPHPRAHERSFVLVPWSLMAPGAFLPGLGGGPVAELAESAPDKGCIRWLAPNWDRPGPDVASPRQAPPQAPVGAPSGKPVEARPQVPLAAGRTASAPSEYVANGPGVPGFFAEARRGRVAFRGLGQSEANLEPPLKAVPYQSLPPRAPGVEDFKPRLERVEPPGAMPSRQAADSNSGLASGQQEALVPPEGEAPLPAPNWIAPAMARA
ncbi:MAG: 2-amino-4-hydroxy-6-hydroxymethyldihydropteridine diphosphokinase [Bifidobacteriaceae bacterium]|jgi:dihydroneopterin aldolase/2-amino-4-hydroxy-6-hydroxymethyldihydropteridine diphosphokinase|nr:2-amino-4-hydroxy-6-hydroxymethyldihydropteridine diphosphokinase [Bifidobacteriaceae bacterium]